MKKLILLVTFAIVRQLVKGQLHPPPIGTVTCHKDHTVTIRIQNVPDIAKWTPAEWRLQNVQSNASCEPTFSGTTVTYTKLLLPDCARQGSIVDSNDTIKYDFEINVAKTDGGKTGQVRAYDHKYNASCIYHSVGYATTSFIPVVNDEPTHTRDVFLTFTLKVFTDAEFTIVPSESVSLDVPLYVKAQVLTQKGFPNLDLFLVRCWASSNNRSKNSVHNKVVFIIDGCGDDRVNNDFQKAFDYACTNYTSEETFSINSFRFFGFTHNSLVYFHCDLRVCVAGKGNPACECPADPEDCALGRKRRLADEYVKEFHARSNPFYLVDKNKVTEKQDDGSKEQSQPFSTNVAIIAPVIGAAIVILVICTTVYLVHRDTNHRHRATNHRHRNTNRRPYGDLNVTTKA